MFWRRKLTDNLVNDSPTDPAEWIRAAKLADIAYMEPDEVDQLFRSSKKRASNFNFVNPNCVTNFEHELVVDVIGELDGEYRFIQSKQTGTDVYM